MVNHKPTTSPKTPRKPRRLQCLDARYSFTPTRVRRRGRAPSPQTPAPEHIPQPDTVKSAKIEGASECLKAKGIPHDPREIFEHFDVKQRSCYNYIAEGASARTRKHRIDLIETRGRATKMTGAQVREVDHFLEEVDIKSETQRLPWQGVAWSLDLDVNAETLRRTMREALTWGKYDACVQEELPQRTQDDRVRWCRKNQRIHPTLKSWKRVRWSDEFHAGFGPEGQLKIFRKRGTTMLGRYDNLQHVPKPTDHQMTHKVHCWAAVGWDFKTDLIFYEPGNKNGAVSHRVYIDQILEKEVRKWVERGDDFILEQDGAGGHGGGPKARWDNPVKVWFEEMGVKMFFNCHDSPDLTLVENCWQAPKDFCRKTPHWDVESLKEILREGWEQVTKPFINDLVKTMPQRLHDCIESGGKRTAY